MPHKNLTTDYGAMHFAARKDLFEIQRTNNFEFIIPKAAFDNLRPYGENSETMILPDANENLRLSVASTSIPHFAQSIIEVQRGNTTTNYAGKITWEPMEVQFYDFIGAKTKDILMGWQAMSGNPIYQTVGQQDAYKITLNLAEYPPDYSEIVRLYRVVGCWITNLREDNSSSENNAGKKITATIKFDYAYPVY